MDNCYENVFRLFVIHFIYISFKLKLRMKPVHIVCSFISVFKVYRADIRRYFEIGSVSKIYVEFLRGYMVPILIFASAQLIWHVGKHPAFKL